jgi:hypothetical protein
LAPELNFLCNLQNPGFKLHDLIFFNANSYKKQKHVQGLPTGLYKNGHNWQTHMLHHLGVGPSNWQRSVNGAKRL